MMIMTRNKEKEEGEGREGRERGVRRRSDDNDAVDEDNDEHNYCYEEEKKVDEVFFVHLLGINDNEATEAVGDDLSCVAGAMVMVT